MMKKQYESPALTAITLMSSEAILAGSEEEVFDINVSFDALWGA